MPSRSNWITTARGTLHRDELASLILNQRDNGSTLQQCADFYGLATRQIARQFWIRGLRNAGRADEIQTRSISVEMRGRRFVIDSNDLADTFTFAGEGWTTFGAEIECFALGLQGCARSLREKNIEAHAEGYNHSVREHWKVVMDSSINGGHGAEVVSPILRGDDGLREMRTAMMALRESGARINSSCGGHVHIGVDGWLDRHQQANVIENWWRVCRAVEMLILPKRRGHYRWAKRWTKEQARRVADLWRAGETNRWSDRYMDLNIECFGRYGTFEMRSHNGSLNGRNHGAWVIINQAVMRWIADAMEHEIESLWDAAYVDGYRAPRLHEIQQYVDDHIANGGSCDVDTLDIINESARNQRIAITDDECVQALHRMLDILVLRGFITDEVRAHARDRAEWIKNRARTSDGI